MGWIQFILAMLILAPASVVHARQIQIVALGDSLTAGFGLPDSAAFPNVLQRRLKEKGFDVLISNAGVSGDTTAGGLARLEWSTPAGTDLVIVELGANDMLRNLPPSAARANLDALLSNLHDRRIATVLAGMNSLANWGDRYRQEFESIYPDLSRKYVVPLYPFFLEGVTGRPELMLPDGLHPNAKGVERIVEGFLPFIEPVLIDRFGPPAASATSK
ncbi:MAG: arylesterase [Beijerinckiaceae bacterium]